MRPTLKKLIMSLFAAVILLPGVSKITADAQYIYWRRPVRIIEVQPYYPVVRPYYPAYYPVYDPYFLPTYGVVGPFPYLQEMKVRTTPKMADCPIRQYTRISTSPSARFIVKRLYKGTMMHTEGK
jgi:hypothetical protein